MSNARGNIGNGRKIAHELLRIDDGDTRINKMVQLAIIEELDLPNKRARVRTEDDYVTPFLQFLTTGSDDIRIWNPPNVGDKVLILCLSGETVLGYILPYVYPVAFDGSGRKTYEFIASDGLKVTHDINDNEYEIIGYGNNVTLNQNSISLNLSGTSIVITDGEITMSAAGTTVTVNGSGLTCSADVSDPLGSMQEMRNRYNSHTHPGDSGGTTGPTNTPMT